MTLWHLNTGHRPDLPASLRAFKCLLWMLIVIYSALCQHSENAQVQGVH